MGFHSGFPFVEAQEQEPCQEVVLGQLRGSGPLALDPMRAQRCATLLPSVADPGLVEPVLWSGPRRWVASVLIDSWRGSIRADVPSRSWCDAGGRLFRRRGEG